MSEDENLIVLKKSSLKKFIGRFFAFIIKAYIQINKETTVFWRRLFKSEGRIRTLLESDAIILFFNTILCSFIAAFFRGLIAEIFLVAYFLNILAFLIVKMEWTQKLLK